MLIYVFDGDITALLERCLQGLKVSGSYRFLCPVSAVSLADAGSFREFARSLLYSLQCFHDPGTTMTVSYAGEYDYIVTVTCPNFVEPVPQPTPSPTTLAAPAVIPFTAQRILELD